MGFYLFFFLFGHAGPMMDGSPFETKLECDKAAEVVVEKITEYNQSTENVQKILVYAVMCAPIKEAPQGKAI